MKKEKYDYINNKELLKLFIEWDKENEQMPERLAKAIMLICDQLTKSGKFVGYTWREDMYGDAILACFRAAKNFDPNKTNNPFAFLTTVAFNACRRRINIEHGLLATQSSFMHSLDNMYELQDSEDNYGFVDNSVKNYSLNNVKEYVHPLERKKKKEKEDIHADMFGNN